MEVHGDDMVRPGRGEEVGHQPGHDGSPGFVNLVRSPTGIVGQHHGHTPGAVYLGRVDHGQNLQEITVSLGSTSSSLNDVNISAIDTLLDLNTLLAVTVDLLGHASHLEQKFKPELCSAVSPQPPVDWPDSW